MVSLQSHFIITNRLFDMWPLFNRARFFAQNVSSCSSYTSYKNWSVVFSERFKKSPQKLNSFVKICNNQCQYTGFNEIVALNSTAQFIKDDYFLHAVQLFSTLSRARSCWGKYNSVQSLKGHGLESRQRQSEMAVYVTHTDRNEIFKIRKYILVPKHEFK